MEQTANKSRNLRRWINILSVAIPVAVAALFGIKIRGIDHITSSLPPVYAGINALTAVLLVVALVLAKQRKLKAHENVIKFCMGLSVAFLLCYIAYHISNETTVFGDSDGDGILDSLEKEVLGTGFQLFYYILLTSHIILSVVVIPFVLYSFLHGIEGNYEKHRRLTKIAWPIWFYVAVTGVVVYFMIAPYYQH